MNKEKGKLSLEAQKRELLLLHHTNSGCTGREAGLILVLVRGCEQRIYPQLLSDRSKHREFFTVCATRWLIHCESLVQLDMMQTVLVPVDVKNLLKNDHSYDNTGIAVRAQPAATLGQPFYPGNSRCFILSLKMLTFWNFLPVFLLQRKERMSCMCCPSMEATWDFLRGQCYSQNLLPGWISSWYSMPMPSASGRRQSLTAQTQSRLCLARSNGPKDSGSLQYISPFGNILFPHLLLQVSILLDILWLVFDHHVFFQNGVKADVNIWSEPLWLSSHMDL